jgi:putative hemolysin
LWPINAKNLSTPTKYIDIEKVISEKNPTLGKWLPKFIINYIKRIAHEDDVNRAMNDFGHLYGVDFVNACMEHLNAEVVTHGLENVPKEGGVVLASNHPLGGLDGIAFMCAVGRMRSDQQFLVNDILLNIKNFEPLFIPVNKHGANPRFAMKMIDEAYASESAVMVFPAGLVSRLIDGKIQDLEWTKSFVSKAKSYNKDIIPVHIGGQNSKRFYRISRWRKALGIKANIEMFFLVDEMYKMSGKTIEISFGKPIPSEELKSGPPQKWAKKIREEVYKLERKK